VFKLIKWLFLLAFVGTLLSSASYAAARLRAGQIVGSNPPLSGRTVDFAFKGVEDLTGNPRAWVVTYRSSQLPGVRGAKVFISPTGKLIGTVPPDLGRRIEAWERSREP
jgi:hypothetical protein